MRRFDSNLLRKGDVLIYWTPCLADFIISAKTFSRRAGHIEIYHGGGKSIAARSSGVNEFELRLDGLEYVRRPWAQPDFVAADRWFEDVAKGQKYDWIGLLSFALAKSMHRPRHQFCSELATRYCRKAGFAPFDHDYSADMVPPGFFLVSPAFWTVWNRLAKPPCHATPRLSR